MMNEAPDECAIYWPGMKVCCARDCAVIWLYSIKLIKNFYFQIIKSSFLHTDIIKFFEIIYCQISDRELPLMLSICCVKGM